MSAKKHYIGGEWVGSATVLPVINPSDGQIIGQIARGGAAEIDAAVKAAHQ